MTSPSSPAILEGYSPLDWPDLSCTRVPQRSKYAVHHDTPRSYTANEVLLALAPLLGAYCDTLDLLVGTDGGVARLTLEGSDVKVQLDTQSDVGELRRFLQLSPSQPLAVAGIYMGEEPKEPTAGQEYPLTFIFTDRRASLAADTFQTHRDVASLLLAQLVARLNSTELSDNLKSISIRVPPDQLASVHPHIPLVQYADEYLAMRAKSDPDRLALEWLPVLEDEKLDVQSMSYSVFDRKANQMARWLKQAGLRLEDRVAVCMQRDLDFHVALFAILRAGGCYVPIDGDLPLERKRFIAEDSNAVFIFVGEENKDTFKGLGTRILEFDNIALRDLEGSIFRSDMTPQNLAFLLYTSGTTGTPKGCLLTHEGLAQALYSLGAAASNANFDRDKGKYLAVASVAFDVHLAEIFIPLTFGIPLLSAPRSALLENLPHWIKALGISHVGIVPSLIEATLMTVDDGEGDMCLRYIACGGEKMSDTILEKWSSHPLIRVANFYGPSEATIGCCYRIMEPNTPKSNIGSAFANVSAYVVNSKLEVLPRGAAGELLVEGPLVGRGYHGRDDLTKKVFLDWKGGKAYRTGDLVRMMPDSTIEVIGRIDSQIKLRGVRIESEGVSTIVRSAIPPSPDFKLDAVSLIAKHPHLPFEQLVTFISWDTTVTISTRRGSTLPQVISAPSAVLSAIRRKCTVELANYMRPSHIIPVSWLPMNGNGKTDVKVLKSMFTELDITVLMPRTSSSTAVQRDLTTDEERILAVLETQLGLSLPPQERTPSLNLFACGLDSIGIIQFCVQLKDLLGRPVAVSDVMINPTVAGVAAALSTSNHQEVEGESFTHKFSQEYAPEVSSSFRSDFEECLPPFSLQSGVLAQSADNDENDVYVQHVILRLNVDVDIQALERAWSLAVERHSILRTVFYFTTSLVQVVLPSHQTRLPWNLLKVDRPAKDEDLQGWFMSSHAPRIAGDINNTLSTIPAFRLSLFGTATNTYLTLSIHHALFDGISLPFILSAAEELYFSPQDSISPPTSAASILDAVATVDEARAQAYYETQFAKFIWPSQIRTPSTTKPTGRAMQLKRSLTEVKAAAQRHNVTLQALLLATYAGFLASEPTLNRTGANDVTFGVIRSGRLLPVAGIDTAVFPTLAVVPVRVDFSNPQSSSLGDIQREISKSVEFEHIPLSRVQRWVRGPGSQPLFETLFSVSVRPLSSNRIWSIERSELGGMDYILAVELVADPAKDVLVVQAAWDGQQIDAEAMKRFFSTFEDSIFHLAEDGQRTLPGRDLTVSGHVSSEEEGSDEEAWVKVPVDPELVDKLRITVAEFLRIDVALVFDDTSLVSLGLDSIRSVGLARKLKQDDVKVAAAEVLKCLSVTSLAKLIVSKRLELANGDGAQGRLVENLREYGDIRSQLKAEVERSHQLETGDEVFPATTLQSGMLSQTLASGGHLYVHAFPLNLSSSIDCALLCDAWRHTVDMLSILRTSFLYAEETGRWAQVVHKPGRFFDWTATTYSSGKDSDTQLKTLLDPRHWAEASQFAIPPIKFLLLRPQLDEGPTPKLFIVMHHALYDGLSVGKLFETVQARYETSQPSAPLVQFTDILPQIVGQEKAGAKFWVDQLQGFSPAPLPRKTLRTGTGYHAASRTISTSFESAITSKGVSLQCIGQLTLAKLLCSRTGEHDIVFGHVVSGRSISGAEDIIGPVLNTIPCRVRLQQGMRNISTLKSIHSSNISALSWQHASLRLVQREYGVPHLWDTLFLYQPLFDSPQSQKLWEFNEDVEMNNIRGQYPLNIELHQTAEGFQVKAACSHDVMDQKELATFLREYEERFVQCTKFPNSAVLDGLPNVSKKAGVSSSAQVVDISGPLAARLLELLSSVTKIPIERMESSTPLVVLGIDSITAIQIVSRCKKAGIKVSATDIINSATIGELVGKSVAYAKSSSEPVDVNIDVGEAERSNILAQLGTTTDIERITYLSPGMKWLIGTWQRAKGSRFQHAFAFTVSSDVDSQRLKDAWLALVSKHQILRSTFRSADNGSEPRIVTFGFENIAQDHLWSEKAQPLNKMDTSLHDIMLDLLSIPLVMDQPLARAMLLHSGKQRCLILHLHHFQYDAWSLPHLLADLQTIYDQPSITISPSTDLVTFLRAVQFDERQLEAQRHYWQEAYPNERQFVLFPLPASSVRPSHTSLFIGKQARMLTSLSQRLRTSSIFSPLKFILSSVWWFLGLVSSQGLLGIGPSLLKAERRTIYTAEKAVIGAKACEERAKDLSVSLSAVLLAAWAKVQSSYTGAEDATFGLWQSGRTGSTNGIAHLAVSCMNVLPMNVKKVDREAIQLAADVQLDLQRRTDVVEQSDLEHIDKWVGGQGKPMCNVYVNLVKVGADVGASTKFQPIKVPYAVPEMKGQYEMKEYSITKLIQDDIMLDIGVDEVNDSILISVDTSILNEAQAKDLVQQWATNIRSMLFE